MELKNLTMKAWLIEQLQFWGAVMVSFLINWPR
jgi:hypothetical protein